jgi:hypothetical protein
MAGLMGASGRGNGLGIDDFLGSDEDLEVVLESGGGTRAVRKGEVEMPEVEGIW